MKSWKCPDCAEEHYTEDNIVSCICSCCLSDMREYPRKEKFRETVRRIKNGRR